MRCVKPVAALFVVLAPGSLGAHWIEHSHLPVWAQRGVMRSCVCPFDALRLREWIDTDPLACHFNVLFTEQTAWEDARTPSGELVKHYLKPRGGHLFFYTCPNSIWYDEEFERACWRDDLVFSRYRLSTCVRYPYAKGCVNHDSDGRPTIAYPWPSRRHRTSYFSTRWVQHHKQIMDYMVKGRDAVTNPTMKRYMQPVKWPGIVDGFYFDNAGQRDDWGPLAMARWKEISTRHFGKVVDPKTAKDPRVRLLWKDMQHRAYIEFHNAFRKHGWTYDRPRLTLLGSHGPYGYHGHKVGFPDIEFYESTYHVQPQGDNIWDLKCGLARTHGKAQSSLNHERFRPTRLTGDNSFAVLHWTLSREFARLSLAECLAMDANHMVQLGPLVYANRRYAEEYRLYHEFNRQLEPEIYRNATPGAKLAVLWPIASEARGTPDNGPLGKRLWTLGFPYEVVVEHDLTADVWPKMGMETLILPDARCLDEQRVAVILDWVNNGGQCLVSRSLAERTEMGFAQQSASARVLLGKIRGPIRYSPMFDFILDGFELEKGGRVWLPARQHFSEKTPEGTVAVEFTGAPGKYDVRLTYLDEADGISTLTVYRNKDRLTQFKLDKLGDRRHTKVLTGVELAPGDRIRIHALQHSEEFCRIFDLSLAPTGADPGAITYRNVGRGRVAFAPKDLKD
jgi:hypothetical protein